MSFLAVNSVALFDKDRITIIKKETYVKKFLTTILTMSAFTMAAGWDYFNPKYAGKGAELDISDIREPLYEFEEGVREICGAPFYIPKGYAHSFDKVEKMNLTL